MIVDRIPTDRPRLIYSKLTGRGALFLLGVFALMLTIGNAERIMPGGRWTAAILSPDGSDINQIIIHHGFIPRLVVAALCGWALGLAGSIFQHVLRNRIAEPTTLGVSAGAQLALVIAALWAPGVLEFSREMVAFCGSMVALLIVFAVAWDKALSPDRLTLAGLFVCLYFGALGTLFYLLDQEAIRSYFIWGSGSLIQNDWSGAFYLLPRIVVASVLAIVFARPFGLLTLNDDCATNLGMNVFLGRLSALAIATGISAIVVSAVGVIGFIGMAAPTLAHLSGARRFSDEIFVSPMIGALLLWFADQGVQALAQDGMEIPTGVAVAFLGAPLLVWLIARSRSAEPLPQRLVTPRRMTRPSVWITVMSILLATVVWLSLHLGQGPQGLHLSTSSELVQLYPFRFPRVLASCSAGAMLAIAGILMQRLTGNSMASPEFLGISSGACFGVIVVIFATSTVDLTSLMIGADVGAFLALLVALILARRHNFSPNRLLLTGIGIGTALSALVTLLIASGDPRMQMLLGWMAGSTYYVGEQQAKAAFVSCIVLLAMAASMSRWLELLPLGDAVRQAVGLSLGRSRLAIVLVAALLTAAGTLVVGPLSFVGLLGPHLVKLSGIGRPLPQLLAAAVTGALIMTVADWLGRTLIFPFDIPAGLFATFLGGPILLILMWCRGR